MKQPGRIAVLGAGNVGHAMAGHLAMKGYEVRLYNRSEQRIATVREAGGVHLQQAVEGFGRPSIVTTDLGEAVAGAEIIMVTVPAFAHRSLAEALVPHVQRDQIVVFQPGALGSALEFESILLRSGKGGVAVAETASCLYSSRLVGPARVSIRAVKKAVELAALPASETGRVLSALREPFAGGYVPAQDVLQIGLGNSNPVYHCAPCLCNFGRIEQGEDWPFFEFLTPSVVRLVDAIDRERLSIAGAVGVKVPSFWEFLEAAYGVTDADYVHRVRKAYGRGQPSTAPKSVDDRYLTEDIPFGLVPWSSFAKLAGVPTPTIDALIQMACALYGQNFWETGRTVESLGLIGLSPTEIKARVTGGVRV